MGSTVLTPTPKVTAAMVAGAIVTVLAFLVNLVFHVDMPVEVGTLINLVIMSAAAYFKRDKIKF